MQLLIVDTAQIQPYIFGSNRLRENIGASYLVAQATGEWALRLIAQFDSNVKDAQTGELDPAKHVDDPNHNATVEVLYTGGGNVVALFREEAEARQFVRDLSRKVLLQAPNLQLVIAQRPFDWVEPSQPGERLAQAIDALFVTLAGQGRARRTSQPQLGLGVTQACRATGLPATDWTPRIKDDATTVYPASAETLSKIDVTLKHDSDQSEADRRLREMLKLRDDLAYPVDFDDLGRSEGEHSFIAVVHADGNSMGQRIRALGRVSKDSDQYITDNRVYIDRLRQFSTRMNDAAQAALRDVVTELTRVIPDGDNPTIDHHTVYGDLLTQIPLQKAKDEKGEDIPGHWYIPFRPIVFGGDDVTFVCDGRLGLSLALIYLKAFEQHTASLTTSDDPITACAGIAIVKTHYPFARAYRLAEELCGSAKKLCRDKKVSGLDWHFALSGLAGDLDDIRRREYLAREGSLTLRPVTLYDRVSGVESQCWPIIERGVAVFQDQQQTAKNAADWTARRNKVKALRDALRGGSEAVRHFRERFLRQNGQAEKLPDVGLGGSFRDNGWNAVDLKPDRPDKPARACGYFDAIELADWFIPLPQAALRTKEG